MITRMKSSYYPALAAFVASIAIVLAVSAPRSRGQFVYSATPVGGWWPPHPSNQVQLYSSGHAISNPAEAELELYVVPGDRWLVLVPGGFVDPASGSAVAPVGIYTNGSTYKTRLVEDRGGQLIDKALDTPLKNPHSAGPAAMTPLGWTFAPGSRVILAFDPSQGGETVSYNLFGYLVPL